MCLSAQYVTEVRPFDTLRLFHHDTSRIPGYEGRLPPTIFPSKLSSLHIGLKGTYMPMYLMITSHIAPSESDESSDAAPLHVVCLVVSPQ